MMMLKMWKVNDKVYTGLFREHSGSVVYCSTWDRGATGLSLTGVTALCPWARHINPSLVLVQPRKTRPFIIERLLMEPKKSNQTNTQVCLYSCTNLQLTWYEYPVYTRLEHWELQILYQYTLSGRYKHHTYPITLSIMETPKQILWQTVKTQMKCSIMLHFIRVCAVC